MNYISDKYWLQEAIKKIEADFNRSADTHLIKIDIPSIPNIQLYLKDESTHPSGSLKHRLARSLFLYGLCNGRIQQNTTIIEASSGSTAISEAYFAKLLNLPFITVIPHNTSKKKIEQIEFYGGLCKFVKAGNIYDTSKQLADQIKGHYMDQFSNAERATDWRGNNNIATSIFEQMSNEPHPIPSWIVVGAGTGGTSATIGRFIRLKKHQTKMAVVDPDNSVFYEYFNTGNKEINSSTSSRIEGIGRPRVEPSFIPTIIDKMLRVPDVASIAAIHFLERIINRKCGGSTGTNLIASFALMSKMQKEGKTGSIVSLLCDGGDRYLDSYYNPIWLQKNNLDISSVMPILEDFYKTGYFTLNLESSEL